MDDGLYVVMTVECALCKTKQKVHVAISREFARADTQSITCLNCNKYFKVTVADRIIRGPFPA
jgi:hypothetical protein